MDIKNCQGQPDSLFLLNLEKNQVLCAKSEQDSLLILAKSSFRALDPLTSFSIRDRVHRSLETDKIKVSFIQEINRSSEMLVQTNLTLNRE